MNKAMKTMLVTVVLLTGCSAIEQAQQEIAEDRRDRAERIKQLQRLVDENTSDDVITSTTTITHPDGSRTTVRSRTRVPQGLIRARED